jgi:hypothetical protein
MAVDVAAPKAIDLPASGCDIAVAGVSSFIP